MSYLVSIFSYTENGKQVAKEISTLDLPKFRDEKIEIYIEESNDITEEIFNNRDAIIFVSATGIAIRKIAPFINSKLTDPAVIVIDECKNFVIPILAGHIGGANDFAKMISLGLKSIPVITTATDINGYKAIDSIASENGMIIKDSVGIKKINAKILSGEEISIYPDKNVDVIISSDIADENRAELFIYNKRIVVGVGCRKDTDEKLFEDIINRILYDNGLMPKDVYCVASIDLKKDEKAIINYTKKYDTKFVTFSASELTEVEGDFDESEFVKEITGVSNVSERAAVLVGHNGHFIQKRIVVNGITVSIFEMKKTITL